MTAGAVVPLQVAGAGLNGFRNRRRAELYALADYYVWSARRGHVPCGNDPRDGTAWKGFGHEGRLARRIGRAENRAAAAVVYAAARALECPLPGKRG